MEVEIISSQSIKPSVPTPKLLKTHKLSLLDQFLPPVYIPMLLFYTFDDGQTHHTNDTISHRLVLLKQSLSETLTHFYPFAGRIKDTLSIDCNDEGVYYVEAKVNSNLIEFFSQPNVVSYIHKLFPSQPKWKDPAVGSHVAMIQVNCFTCGGIAVSASVSHTIADGAAASFFLNSWGAAARGVVVGSDRFPNFDALPANFPQNKVVKDLTLSALIGPFKKTGKCVPRRFWFDAENIAKIRAKAWSSTVGNPTRLEAVSALLWKCIMGSLKAKYGSEKTTLAAHVVNMRRRVIPQYPDSYMGNFLWIASALSEKEKELPNLVIKFREAISKINCEFVKSFEGERGSLKYVEIMKEMIGLLSNGSSDGVEYINYTSWSKFGLYEVDFGWGKPAWVATSGSKEEAAFMNVVILMDTPSGDGIEAWVYLEEDLAAIVEQDKELLAFATVDPNPLELNSSASQA